LRHSLEGGNPDNKRKEKMLKKPENSKKCCPNILFACPESVLDKSKARFRRLQNSPAAQTLVIADLALRQDLLAKTLSIAAQINICASLLVFSEKMNE
jgi:hypothetical protein